MIERGNVLRMKASKCDTKGCLAILNLTIGTKGCLATFNLTTFPVMYQVIRGRLNLRFFHDSLHVKP